MEGDKAHADGTLVSGSGGKSPHQSHSHEYKSFSGSGNTNRSDNTNTNTADNTNITDNTNISDNTNTSDNKDNTNTSDLNSLTINQFQKYSRIVSLQLRGQVYSSGSLSWHKGITISVPVSISREESTIKSSPLEEASTSKDPNMYIWVNIRIEYVCNE